MEHVNTGEAHDALACPGPDGCACQRGMLRLLAELDDGTRVTRREP